MKALLPLFFFISFTTWADRECNFTLVSPSVTIQLKDTAEVLQKSISLSRGQQSPQGHCYEYKLFFSKGTANSYQRKAFNSQGQSIPYNLYHSVNLSGILKDHQDAANWGEFILGGSPAKNTVYNAPFFISAPGLNTLASPSGIYTDNIKVSLYSLTATSSTYVFDTSVNLTVLFQIFKNIQLSLIDEGGAFDPSSTSRVLDFGLLKQNAKKGADLRVVSNGPYQIKISSQQNGKLKQSLGDTITYSFKVNQSSINLASSASTPVVIGTGTKTANSGDLYNLIFTISESVDNKQSGMYQDVLTITAIAN